MPEKPEKSEKPEKLAHYELLTPLGAGGMGEVFRARDTRLDRDVAIKILPEALAKDPERIARFDREAKTLASLQHPNIATVHDFMNLDGTAFLVMELVDGEDLSVRLERGPIEAEEVRQMAIQLASGLEAAHERNIVHRDLKPANVKLTPDGQVKILDFGLARAVTGDTEEGSDPMLSPTITQAMTQAGTILGTAAYMSPEQARGKRVDKRADIWAFGVLLYEMLTGERLFEGETTSDTLASVLKNPVDFDQLGHVPPDMVWVMQRCLDRNPTRRLRDIGEARLVLSGDSTVSQIGTPAAVAPLSSRRAWIWPAVAAALALALVAVVLTRPGPPEERLLHAGIPVPRELNLIVQARQPGPPALSPDGEAIVFAADANDGQTWIWHRRLDSPRASKLEGTEDGSYPFWSPDSRSIGFFTDHEMLRLDLGSGSPLRLVSTQFGKGASWSEDGNIVFAASYNSPISVVSASGGSRAREVTVLDSVAGENSHRHPFFLPDGQHFLYFARGASLEQGTSKGAVRVGSLDGDVQVPVTGAMGHAEFHEGYLMFAREGALVAQPFSPDRLELDGEPRVILPQIDHMSSASRSGFSVGRDGRMIYLEPAEADNQRRVTVFDRTGQVTEQIGAPAAIRFLRMSPDLSRAATLIGSRGQEPLTIWLVDMESGASSRFAGGSSETTNPVWSPDGRYLAYAQETSRATSIMVRRVDGGGQPIEVYAGTNRRILPESWSPSGRYLTFTDDFEGVGYLELDEDLKLVAEPIMLVDHSSASASAWSSSFLGNDSWVVYHASDTEDFELYVSNLHNPARRFQITSTGGFFPAFDPVRGEIAFVEIGAEAFSVMSVKFATEDSDPIIGPRQSLFRLPMSDLDSSVEIRGDRIFVGFKERAERRREPMFVSDWRLLLRR